MDLSSLVCPDAEFLGVGFLERRSILQREGRRDWGWRRQVRVQRSTAWPFD